MAFRFEERTSGREPSGAFGVDHADWTRTFVLYELLADGSSHTPDTQDVAQWIQAVIGTTRPGPSPRALGTPGGAGSLDRSMPLCDSQFRGLFADSVRLIINPMEGYRDSQPDPGALAVPPTQGFALYNGVEYQIVYQPRPYAVLPNERMTMQTRQWFDVDGSPKLLKFYGEWLRYVQILVDDVDSQVSASVASAMAFRVPSKTPSGIDGSQVTQIPAMMVPDMRMICRFFQVPLRYLTSPRSHLVKWKGHISQWEWLAKDGRSLPPGSILYTGAKVIKSYTPPQFLGSAQVGAIDGFVGILAGSFYAEPLVDLELNFLTTVRATPPADAIPAEELPNPNWIPYGFNLQPCFATKRFHYAHAVGLVGAGPFVAQDYTRWVPSYLSAPIPHILFQDPDVDLIVDL